MRRLAGLLWHPRSTMAEVVQSPAFIPTWVASLAIVGLGGWMLLGSPVGRQALVDERVRAAEALGGRIDDTAYAELQAHPPYAMFLVSGGRVPITPVATCLVAAALVGLAARDGIRLGYRVALAVTVQASVVLVMQQLVAMPMHVVRESLSDPTTLAGLLPLADDGTWASSLLGAVDVFGVWWLWLLALGLGAATGRPARRYFGRLLVAYAAVAAGVATVLAAVGTGGI